MTSALNLAGKRFGRLTAIARAPDGTKNRSAWVCRCDCGTEIVRTVTNLSCMGDRQSCGCLKQDEANFRLSVDQSLVTRWKGMKSRCGTKSHSAYHNYGGRGIKVCAEWRTFRTFATWALANGYRPDLQLDRIDNDGDYTPSNCRWVTRTENLNNRRNCRKYQFFGETMTAKQAEAKYGIADSTIICRIQAGVTPNEAVTRQGWVRHNISGLTAGRIETSSP